MKQKLKPTNGEIKRIVISQSKTKLKGTMQEMVVYHQKQGNRTVSVTRNEAVRR